MKQPQTLLEVIRLFADERVAFEAVRDRRWPDGVTCPHCGCDKVRFMEVKRKNARGKESVRRLWNCNGCRQQFTAKTGTIFEDSPIPFSQWLPAMWMIANCKNGISSYELHRALGVTQKTAWFMLHRIRLAMQDDSMSIFSGHIEVDESYVGGKAKNMHRGARQDMHSQGGGLGKQIVMGILDRGMKQVKTFHIGNTKRSFMEDMIRGNVEHGSNIYTDQHGSYRFLNTWFLHQTVDHAIEYVRGQVHTNGLENYWSLLKRTIGGTYVSVEPFHLFRYLDEQSFRYNERRLKDGDRFFNLTGGVVGKRITYRQLIGKELAPGLSN